MTNASLSRITQKDSIGKGIAYGCTAFFLLAIMSAFAKLLSQHYTIGEIIFYRNMVPVIPMMFYGLITGGKSVFIPQNLSLLFARVFVGVTGLFATFSTLKYLPMADATVLFMAANLIVPVLAFFFLREHVGLYRWGAILIGFCGVLLVAAPTGQVNMIGVVFGIVAAVFQGSIQIILRFLKQEHPFTVTFYFVLGGALYGALALVWGAHIPSISDLPFILGVGITGGLAQYFLTSAFKYAPASIISPFNYTGLIWATGLDIALWGKIPDWHVMLGGVIIVASGLFVYARERRAARIAPRIS